MISLIISFYKRADFIALIFQALGRQSYEDFEVIVAEDDNVAETVRLIEHARKTYRFPIKHVSQEDNGFRKTKILNAAVRVAAGEQLVFLDGDCIPHRHFLKAYAKAIGENNVCYGRRTFLSKKLTTHLIAEKSIKKLCLFSVLFSSSKKKSAALYLPFLRNIDKQYREIKGCNWGTMRKHVIAINGFDEDYTRACVGEDTDIDWRLKAGNLMMKSMKNKAVVYHLFHHSNYSKDDQLAMSDLLRQKKEAGHLYCLNGINKQ